jgi:5-methylcytosine-specific restriction protein A
VNRSTNNGCGLLVPHTGDRYWQTHWMVERLRGRRGVEQRRRRLQAEPLCRDCKVKGVIRPAVTPDHIKPLAQGGTDTDDNIRCLCAECHDKRTREQFGQKQRVAIGVDGWPLDR